MRHRVGIEDAALVVVGTFFVGLVAYQYDFTGGLSQHKAIEFQEMLGLAVVLAVAVFLFAWRRMAEQEREIARRVIAEHRAYDLAHSDPLTGLANRRLFEQALATAIAAPSGAERAHAVLMIDLNGFKKVNDAYGHPVGDQVLSIVGQRFSGAMRDGDLLARLGGDEFAVIARDLAGPEAATSIANRIIKTLESPIESGEAHHRIGAGIGIALVPRDGKTAEEVLRKADVALYRAKAETRSVARFFEEDMDRHSLERDVLERDLAVAIGTDALRPWYQPIVDLQTEEVLGFEALARWTHPTLGNIPPDRFIPIAEDCGLMSELSDYLLRCACRDAQAWPDGLILSFNISPAQLKDRTLGLRILSILGESGFPPGRLEIEITESALVRDLAAAKEVLSSLRDAGIHIALDDFGTGYSSLYHLRNFKFDKIKIDRGFVESMDESDSGAIVRALTGLGIGLGLTITAEGIEHVEQRTALLSGGCQQGQGFLFSRAIPAQEVRGFLARGREIPNYTAHR